MWRRSSRCLQTCLSKVEWSISPGHRMYEQCTRQPTFDAKPWSATNSAIHWFRSYKKDCVELRQGNVIEKDGNLYQVVKAEHTRGIARQSGNIQLELRDMKTRNKVTQRVKPNQSVEVVRLEDREYSILYIEGSDMMLMDSNTYEQIPMDIQLFRESEHFARECAYLDEPPQVKVLYHNTNAISCELPPQVEFVVDECDPAGRGQMNDIKYKAAFLKAGTKIKVPDFIEPGNKVIVDTRTGEFVKRGT